jgi:hypothetical protein
MANEEKGSDIPGHCTGKSPAEGPYSSAPHGVGSGNQAITGKAGGQPPTSDASQSNDLVQEVRLAEKWQIAINGTLAIIGIMALFIYESQLKEMRSATCASIVAANAAANQSRISARQLELTERPWVSVAVTPKTDLVQDALHVHMTVHVILKNSGPTPATNVFVNSELFPDQRGDSGARARELCDELANQLAGTKELLFPNVDQGEDIPIGFSSRDVKEWAHLEPEIGVCAVYGPTFRDGSRYATWGIYEFDRQIPLNTKVPLRDIHLSAGKWGGAE